MFKPNVITNTQIKNFIKLNIIYANAYDYIKYVINIQSDNK